MTGLLPPSISISTAETISWVHTESFWSFSDCNFLQFTLQKKQGLQVGLVAILHAITKCSEKNAWEKKKEKLNGNNAENTMCASAWIKLSRFNPYRCEDRSSLQWLPVTKPAHKHVSSSSWETHTAIPGAHVHASHRRTHRISWLHLLS